jgi:hypothetical protein
MVSYTVGILNFEFSACGIGCTRQLGVALGRSAIGFRGMVRSGMVRSGIVRSGIVRSFGWADGAEGTEGALCALGADGVLGALGADSAEGAFGADCFGCAAFAAGSPRGTPLCSSCGT